ncbi:ATP-binding protein [Nonomuraea sp. NPDC050680]|uniref:ATP-binding protein n=1 Tax=Nonomuraea sp. NPDC050680 TaxID=3154630 RepID=UPI0034074453
MYAHSSQVHRTLLRANPDTPRQARQIVRIWSALGLGLESDLLEDVELVVSELVTNSVKHAQFLPGREWVQLSIDMDPASVRVTVTDPGHPTEYPQRRWADSRDSSGLTVGGRGLQIVDHICHGAWSTSLTERHERIVQARIPIDPHTW